MARTMRPVIDRIMDRTHITTCKWGHPLDGQSTQGRFCTECARRRSRDYMRRKRAKANV